MKTTSSRLAAAALAVVAVALACAPAGPPGESRFQREFQRYLSLPNQKVFVIAGDPEGAWVHGYAYKERSQIEAQDSAMEQCNVRRKELSVPSECVVYAIGRDVVWRRPD